MISIYDSKETDFTNNGLVILSDCKSFFTTEKLNDQYEIKLEYPMDSRGKWQYITEGNILKNNDGQLFRIYRKVKTLSGIKANARHIFYDLLDNFIENLTLTNVSGSFALSSILANTQYTHSFLNMSDITTTGNLTILKTNPVNVILGKDGIIDNCGGELFRDNFTIKLLLARGLDRGVLVSYGKNIIGIEETIDFDSLVTRLYPTGKDELILPEKYVDSQYIDNYPNPKVKEVQFSDIETESDLRLAAQNYFISNKCDIPLANYQVDFLELSKTEEYKNYAVLERVYLGDTVTVRHSKLNIDLKCKVISIKKNDLTGRIEKVELGNFKPNLATSLNKSIQGIKNEIVQVTSDYQKAIDNATKLITGSVGGNVVIRQDDSGKPYEILIMDTTDVMTAENVWRWSIGGFGHSSTGVEGPFDTAITQDGSIIGSFITALVINGQQIIAGIIESKTGKWKFNLDSETITLGDKLTFDGTDLVLGSGVTLSWGQVTGTEQVPLRADLTWGNLLEKPTNLLTQDQLSTELSVYVTTGDMSDALLNTLNTSNFNTIITNEYIASLNLIVGNEILMGENASISWTTQITNKPTIPTTASQVGAVANTQNAVFNTLTNNGALPGLFMSNGQLYMNASYIDAGVINASLITTGTLNAERIGGTVINFDNGCSLDSTDGKARLRRDQYNYVSVEDNSIGFYFIDTNTYPYTSRKYCEATASGFKVNGVLVGGTATTAKFA